MHEQQYHRTKLHLFYKLDDQTSNHRPRSHKQKQRDNTMSSSIATNNDLPTYTIHYTLSY